jgi:DNA-nicking Smr family endonuclease
MTALTDLKKLLDAAREKAHAAAKEQSARAPAPAIKAPTKQSAHPPRVTREDIDLSRVFADVKRLPPATRVRHSPTRPAPIPFQRIADERNALEASKYGAEPAPNRWDVGQEHEGEQTFLRRGLASDILGKLRRGQWSVQAELDLHGLNSDDARDALADFLAESRQLGLRCVRVIHGKGLTSPNKEPILKGKVRRWLANWGDVLAYAEAPRHAGGGGAVLILLRGR